MLTSDYLNGFLTGRLAAVIIEFVLFYFITRVRFRKLDFLFMLVVYSISLGMQFAVFIPNDLAYFLGSSVEILFYWGYFRKRVGNLFSIAAITFICSVNTLLTIIPNWLAKFWPVEYTLLVEIISLVITCWVIKRYRYRINSFFNGENAKVASLLIIYFYIFVIMLNEIGIDGLTPKSELIFCLIILIQFIFIIAIYVSSVLLQQKLLKKQEEKNMQLYLHNLESSEDRLRKFKHDYLNLLATLRVNKSLTADQKAIEELEQYTQDQINDPNMWQFKNLNHLHNVAIKNIVLSKLIKMNECGINYSFECQKNIERLPKNIQIFDLVRIIGIVIDNAIEESQKLGKEQAMIKIMFYQEKPDELEFKIMNKCAFGQMNLNLIRQKGYTTKKNHQGYGLANIQEINDHYDNMFIDYSIKDNWFSFTLAII